MNKTNIGLVAHAEKSLKEKWFYGWGSYGQKATTELVNNLVAKWPNPPGNNTMWRNYMLQAVTQKTRLCDCYGLIKSYLWWTDDNGNPLYNATQDTNTAGAFNRAKEKGTLSTLPEIPGLILWMSGHVGVYCGNGRFIELMGNGTGAFEGMLVNGKITKGSKFTHWFKDVNITYIHEQEDEMLKEKVAILEKKIEDLKKRYNTLEEMPVWAKPTISKLIDKKLLTGDGNKLDLSLDMVRSFVINDRAGMYG